MNEGNRKNRNIAVICACLLGLSVLAIPMHEESLARKEEAARAESYAEGLEYFLEEDYAAAVTALEDVPYDYEDCQTIRGYCKAKHYEEVTDPEAFRCQSWYYLALNIQTDYDGPKAWTVLAYRDYVEEQYDAWKAEEDAAAEQRRAEWEAKKAKEEYEAQEYARKHHTTYHIYEDDEFVEPEDYFDSYDEYEDIEDAEDDYYGFD